MTYSFVFIYRFTFRFAKTDLTLTPTKTFTITPSTTQVHFSVRSCDIISVVKVRDVFLDKWRQLLWKQIVATPLEVLWKGDTSIYFECINMNILMEKNN